MNITKQKKEINKLSTNFWILFNIRANQLCSFFIILNVLWMIEMCIDGFIERKNLNAWVEDNWKLPLEITSGLSVIAVVTMFLPAFSGSFGREIYWLVGVMYIVQFLFMLDYRKSLKKYIQDSWFLNSTIFSLVITALAFVSLIAFAVSSIAVFDYQ